MVILKEPEREFDLADCLVVFKDSYLFCMRCLSAEPGQRGSSFIIIQVCLECVKTRVFGDLEENHSIEMLVGRSVSWSSVSESINQLVAYLCTLSLGAGEKTGKKVIKDLKEVCSLIEISNFVFQRWLSKDTRGTVPYTRVIPFAICQAVIHNHF